MHVNACEPALAGSPSTVFLDLFRKGTFEDE